jgi:hypothetical protein
MIAIEKSAQPEAPGQTQRRHGSTRITTDQNHFHDPFLGFIRFLIYRFLLIRENPWPRLLIYPCQFA